MTYNLQPLRRLYAQQANGALKRTHSAAISQSVLASLRECNFAWGEVSLFTELALRMLLATIGNGNPEEFAQEIKQAVTDEAREEFIHRLQVIINNLQEE